MANEIWKTQCENGWPGLTQDVKHICAALNFEDINEINLENVGKRSLRKEVTEACFVNHKEEVKSKMGKKCE